MALADARAICPGLVTRTLDPLREEAFLGALRRWAERFSPWVAAEPPESLALDVTGCAHLFGGEAGFVAQIEAGAADLGLSLSLGLADTLGAAWALARFAGTGARRLHAGDAIDQESRATRSRAQKRRWERGGMPPAAGLAGAARRCGSRRRAPCSPMSVRCRWRRCASRPMRSKRCRRSGSARIADLAALPRAQLARRLGPGVVLRLDQALGRAPEPVAPARPEPVFALRLTLPEPIGREADVLAGLDRLLGPLCDRLRAAGMGARRVRLTLVRVDRGAQAIEVGLARAADAPEAIRPLIALKTGEIDAGFGIEALRLEALGGRAADGAPAPRPARRHEGGAGRPDRRGAATTRRRWPTCSAGSGPGWDWRRSPGCIPPTATSRKRAPP